MISEFYAEELSVMESIPDGLEYYDYIVKNVDIDRSNPNNSHYMYHEGKVDKLDPTKPCKFVKPSTALPDIDTDFPTNFREKIIDYVKEKYGHDKVSQISTFGRLVGRSAVKTVLRTMDLCDPYTQNVITEHIPDEAAISDELEAMEHPSVVLWAVENVKELADYCYIENGELKGEYAEAFQIAIQLEGTFQTCGQHAAGVIISSEPIRSICPTTVNAAGNLVANMDMGDIEKIGGVKFDFLGVDILNKIHEVVGDSILSIPMDDEEIFELIQSGNTKGCFQIEGKLGMDWAQELKPRNIEELAALISIIRPGCVSIDTPIAVMSNYIQKSSGKKLIRHVPLKKIIANRKYYSHLRSVDELTGEIINNKIIDIFSTGRKECFKVKIRKYRKLIKNSFLGSGQYNLECTDDHKLLTPSGWRELKDISVGERIAARKFSAPKKNRSNTISSRHVKGLRVKNADGMRSFSDICYKNYFEKCCICDWSKANLDTNHIDKNRHEDNSPENLCFMCPNCHREYSLGYISVEKLREHQNFNKLPILKDLEWVTYEGKESVGIKETYDISMDSPHHNFIAGNILVHNCLASKDATNRSMTKVYCDRKNGIEVIQDTEINTVIDTHGVIIYQETLLKIAKILAGFNSAESIVLMKCISADSLVYTRNGPKRIDEITNDDFILNVIDGKQNYSKIKRVWPTGKRKVLRISTSNGFSIDLTENHQVLTNVGWLQAKDITKNHFIIIPKRYNPKNNRFINKNLTILTAYFLSEGCYTEKSPNPKITNQDVSVIELLEQVIMLEFGQEQCKRYLYKNGVIDLRLLDNARKFIQANFHKVKSKDKIIPDFIMGANEDIKRIFVSCFFNAEGSFNNLVDNHHIEISSASQNILRQIQAILLQDGIHAGISVKYNKKYCRNYYRLTISSIDDIKIFISLYLDFLSDKKKLIFEQFDVNNEFVKSEVLDELINSDFYYVQVNSIKELDDEVSVYDYETEDDTHCGFINGILVHNSVGKKDAKKLFALEEQFLSGCKRIGKITEDEAKTLFDNIKNSARYLFNKCLCPSTLLSVDNKFITIDEAKIGDSVKTPYGYSKIINKYENGFMDIYEICLEDGKSIRCTLDHKFLCESGEIKPLFEIIQSMDRIMCDSEY